MVKLYAIYEHPAGAIPTNEYPELFETSREARLRLAEIAQERREEGYEVSGTARGGYCYGGITNLYIEEVSESDVIEGVF